MPLNDYPTAKPTYDFYDTVNSGKTAICNGILVSVRSNKADAQFPRGSVTYHWHMRSPVASYLVEDSVGDYHLTERGYDMTFYKEGMATMAQYLLTARQAEDKAGGPGSRKGQAAFQASLVKQFDQTYSHAGSYWTIAPSNPTPYELFGGANTYYRPAAAYLALRQILGSTNFVQAMQHMQREYGGGNITEAELEAAFHRWMPNQSPACQAKLGKFFTEWFDTPYASGGGANRPQITGPGLAGPGFYNPQGGCTRS